MQMRPWTPILNQLMRLLHHNIVIRFWSYLLIYAPPTPPSDLSLSTNIIITAPQIHIRTYSLQVWLLSSQVTLHTRDMSSKYDTANANIPDIEIPTWFELYRLPYNDVIVTKLQMIGVGCIILAWHVLCMLCAVPWHQSNLKGGGGDINLWGSNNNIRTRGQIDRGGWWGIEKKVWSRSARNIMMQQMHQLIRNGCSRSHLHHRLSLCITGLLFASHACSLYHRLDLCIIGLIALVHGKNGWIGDTVTR